jgi:hypothetical protein
VLDTLQKLFYVIKARATKLLLLLLLYQLGSLGLLVSAIRLREPSISTSAEAPSDGMTQCVPNSRTTAIPGVVVAIGAIRRQPTAEVGAEFQALVKVQLLSEGPGGPAGWRSHTRSVASVST